MIDGISLGQCYLINWTFGLETLPTGNQLIREGTELIEKETSDGIIILFDKSRDKWQFLANWWKSIFFVIFCVWYI